jgi:UDP-N-acetylglucosamine enolpyruvyl transferase
VEHLDRGYERLDLKYRALGATIIREDLPQAAGGVGG